MTDVIKVLKGFQIKIFPEKSTICQKTFAKQET